MSGYTKTISVRAMTGETHYIHVRDDDTTQTITYSGIRQYPLVNDGTYQDGLYCINAQSDLETDADHRILAFNHLEAYNSFNWFLLSGDDFYARNWRGDLSNPLSYVWSTQGSYSVSQEWDYDGNSSNVITTATAENSRSWIAIRFTNTQKTLKSVKVLTALSSSADLYIMP